MSCQAGQTPRDVAAQAVQHRLLSAEKKGPLLAFGTIMGVGVLTCAMNVLATTQKCQSSGIKPDESGKPWRGTPSA